jgi:hypothetical protein
MPERKKSRTAKSPITPTETLLNFPSSNLQDIAEQRETLEEATDPDSKDERIIGKSQSRGDFSDPVQVQGVLDQIPPGQDEKGNRHASGDQGEAFFHSPGEEVDHEIDEDMSPLPGYIGYGESDDQRAAEANQLIGSHDGPPHEAEKNIGDGERHDEDQTDSSGEVHETDEPLDSS